MSSPCIPTTGTCVSSLSSRCARALHAARVKPQRTIFFRSPTSAKKAMELAAFAPRRRLCAISSTPGSPFSGDGSGIDHSRTGSSRIARIENPSYPSPVCHSGHTSGIPNPINALVRASVRFSTRASPATPRTTSISANRRRPLLSIAIPHEARSSPQSLRKRNKLLPRNRSRECMAAECATNGIRARSAPKASSNGKVEHSRNRPGGELAADLASKLPLFAPPMINTANTIAPCARRFHRRYQHAPPLSVCIDAICHRLMRQRRRRAFCSGMGTNHPGREIWIVQRALLTVPRSSGLAAPKGSYMMTAASPLRVYLLHFYSRSSLVWRCFAAPGRVGRSPRALPVHITFVFFSWVFGGHSSSLPQLSAQSMNLDKTRPRHPLQNARIYTNDPQYRGLPPCSVRVEEILAS